MSAMTFVHQLEARIRQELPSLTAEQAAGLTDMLDALIHEFQPEWVFAFGSRARGDAKGDSDLDLMLIITSSEEPSYRRAQAAYLTTSHPGVPTDILVWTREEFDRGRPNPATLPGTILREGRTLYAAPWTTFDSRPTAIHLFAKRGDSMQPPFLNDAEDWFERADSDLAMATLALQAHPMLADGVAYHAQQAAEKALKAFLTAYGVVFPKTHDCSDLLAMCAGIEPQFQQYTAAARILSPYAYEFRYPGHRRQPPDAEARAAFQHATDILQFVRDALADASSSASN